MKKDLEKTEIDQPSPEKSNAKFKRIIFLWRVKSVIMIKNVSKLFVFLLIFISTLSCEDLFLRFLSMKPMIVIKIFLI